MCYHKFIISILLVFITTYVSYANETKIWLEGYVKNEIIKVQNHKKSRSVAIAYLVNNKSSIIFQASTADLKSWFFILELNILEDLKKAVGQDEIFNWEVYDITLKKTIDIKLDCKLQDLFVTTFHSHITKQTVRHLVSSQESHNFFINKLNKSNKPLIEGELDKGNDGYIYLTRYSISHEYLKEHQGILNSFFIFESKKIKSCW